MAAPGKNPAILFLGALGRLPAPVLRAVLRGMSAVGLVVSRYRWTLRRNYARVRRFQKLDASDDAIDALLARFAVYYAGSMANLCRICAAEPPVRSPVPVALAALGEIERARRRGRGVILATPHFGDLYSAMLALGEALPLTVLMVGGRNYQWGQTPSLRVVEFLGGAVDVVGALSRNECVLVYDDVDFIPGNRAADLFGAPVFPPHGPARLALSTGASIVPIAALWSPNKTEVVCADAIVPDGRSQEQVEDLCLRALETLITRAPEQWMAFHDLWDLPAMRRTAARFRRRY